jgi:hypothetical protein
MTNDYKENLLEYLTGNIAQGISSATPMYAEVTTSEYNDNPTDLGSLVVRCKDGQGNYNGLDLYYSHGGNKISLVDSKDMTIIKTFTTFASGTPFGTFLNIEVDEVGNAYGLDYIVQNGVNVYRIILLNNISEIPKGYNDYQVILRNSYYVKGYEPYGDDINPQYETFLAKSTQSATYYFALQEGTGSLIMPSLFQINVGAENTWTRLPDVLFNFGDVDIGNIYFDNNDQPIAEYIGTERYDNDWTINKATTIGDNEPTYVDLVTNVIRDYYHSPISEVTNFDITLYSNYNNNFYFAIVGVIPSGSQYVSKMDIYNYDNGNIVLLDEKVSPSGGSTIAPYNIRGKVVNGLFMYLTPQYKSGSVYNLCFSMVGREVKENFFIKTDIENSWSSLAIKRYGVYNLYNEYIINYINRDSNDSPYYLVTYKMVYNQNNYNGLKYKDKSMLVPTQGLLFDSDNNLVFARNLYNLKVYNNQTMATINVPNNLLNNVTISNENLYSSTSYELIDNTQTINKNVYENLYINFINAITMQNRNTNDYSYNLQGSSRLNISSGKDLDYENAKATKIRVTYDDETSYITKVSSTLVNNVYRYSIGVHVPSDNNIQKIEIISNDEVTTYQTISNLNLENNKYYVITQDVHVV